MIRLVFSLAIMLSLMTSPLANASDSGCLEASLKTASLQQDQKITLQADDIASEEGGVLHQKDGENSQHGQHCCCLHVALASDLPQMSPAAPRQILEDHEAQDGVAILHEPLSRPPFHA